MKVAVVGGGVIGICSALAVQKENPNVRVTVISEKWTPDTTGDGSAGFWHPYLLGNVEPSVLRFWCEKTFKFLQDIFLSPEAADCGVGLLSCYRLHSNVENEPEYKDLFLDWRPLTKKELSIFPGEYRHGVFLVTYFVECKKLLPVLMKRFVKEGGILLTKKVKSLTELVNHYDVVINCTGVGAGSLVQDKKIYPIRGQVIRVRAPWIKYALLVDDDYYILPNSEETVCGGTHQENDWNLAADPEDTRKIWQGCLKVIPSLQEAEIVEHWVGLRPGRSEPRLEREVISTPKGELQVIHNYGHGGSGVTLCWGCALHVAQLFQETLKAVKQRPHL